MKLFEFEGKKIFQRYGILVPPGQLLRGHSLYKKDFLRFPLMLKAQTHSGYRKAARGIIEVRNHATLVKMTKELLGRKINGEKVKKILIEEKFRPVAEYYISFSYDTYHRGPVLAISPVGGSGVKKAYTVPIDLTLGVPDFFLRRAVLGARFPREDVKGLVEVLKRLWELFIKEYAVLVEINPLFKTRDGKFVAGDAKIILDDEKLNPGERRFLEMDGDIAILASGGGASLINIDALLGHGGRPANYTEYSGNPPAEVVRDLTMRVLSRRGLKGCWVVGGTANFTDIFETMRGFAEGLQKIKPKPTYPIVIRRDGPRQKEAFAMLREVAKKGGYDFHFFGSETPMSESARIMVKLAYHK